MSGTPRPVDTQHHVETPEGVELSLRLAGVVPRAIAYGADVSLRIVFYVVALITLSAGLGNTGVGAAFMIFALGEVLYPVAFELLGDGQTLGKRMVGIRVVKADGTRIRWQASLLRNVLVFADALPGTYAFALVSMLASREFRRLGDHAADTLVIYVDGKPGSSVLAGAQAVVAVPQPPAIALELDEQAAVLAFGGRSAAFSPARREELARLAAPLLRPERAAAAQLEAVAAHLRGARRKA